MDQSKLNIAIIGGTGKEGKGLAFRWGKAGHRVIIGSRNLEKAQLAVNEIKSLLPITSQLTGDINESAIKQAEIVVITVPYLNHGEILNSLKNDLQGKIIIDVTVPLVPPQVTKVQMPSDGSAAQETQKILGLGCRVASAFQNISYDLLLNNAPILCDVLVCCSDEETKQIVLRLVQDAGLSGWDAGPLENSVVVEGLTSILININKKYHSRTAGIKITGIDSSRS